MIKKFTYVEKHENDPLTHTEWNNLAQDVDAAVNAINNGAGGGGSGSDSHIIFDEHSESNPEGKGNLTIETTVLDLFLDGNKTKGGKINIEPISDLQIKAGDDISLYAHHRAVGDKDLIGLKVLTEASDEKDIPAKLKITTGDITISNADNVLAVMVEIKASYKKTPDYTIDTDFPANTFVDGNIYKESVIISKLSSVSTEIKNDILNAGIGKTRVIKFTDGTTTTFYKFTKVSNADGVTNINFEDSEGFGYLKVRALSIDLRCEEHGGIALLPKGKDGQGNMNKIKFEHGGGDGLEFGTFNTLHTSIYTNDYRFNKSGIWKMATRNRLDNTKGAGGNDKYDGTDSTTRYSYEKQSDDFYDIIDPIDYTTTTKNIVLAGYMLSLDLVNNEPVVKIGRNYILPNNSSDIVFEVTEIPNGSDDQYDAITNYPPGITKLILEEKNYTFGELGLIFNNNFGQDNIYELLYGIKMTVDYSRNPIKEIYKIRYALSNDPNLPPTTICSYQLKVLNVPPKDILFVCQDGTELSLNNDILPAVNYYKTQIANT